jgi:GNAT superfamily N-acetyltransferase
MFDHKTAEMKLNASATVARPDQYTAIGELLVHTYSTLPGMPRITDQPAYYARLRDVGARASNAAITVYVALSPAGDLLGTVDFIHSMDQYGSGGRAPSVPDAAGIRLLAVARAYRGAGLGKRLTGVCIERASAMGRSQVILHTTRAMATAWTMYERLGFVRSEDLDFMQGDLEVYGFRLRLAQHQA